jgi:SAM-dependent methyltransferase
VAATTGPAAGRTGELLRGCSERLRAFVEEAPLERASIFAFVAEQARALPPGARVLDVGAGDAPYRELFAPRPYVSLDHADTLHGAAVDIVGRADDIPVAEGSFDAVLCTQVLEHVPDPLATVCELRRVLAARGRLIATVPFAWEEHEPSPMTRGRAHGAIVTGRGWEGAARWRWADASGCRWPDAGGERCADAGGERCADADAASILPSH